MVFFSRLALLLAAILCVGCGRLAPRYEVDYGYEILKSNPGGPPTVIHKGSVARAGLTEGGGGDVPGVGPVITRVQQISMDLAVIEISLPGGESTTLDVSPKNKLAERFPPGGQYGFRISVKEIRKR